MKRPSDAAVELARKAAIPTDLLVWTKHVRERMAARDIVTEQVLTCLEKGRVVDGPMKDIYGGWKFDLCCRSAGDELTVAVAVNLEEKVVLITAY